MSKIIDANKVQRKLLEECKNIRHFDKDRKKSQIFADGLDFAWVMLDNAPTVKAIPIEWIRKWNIDNYPYTALLMSEIIPKMTEDWEKENGRSK